MKRRFVQQADGELVEVSRDWTPDPRADYHVMPDIAEYRSMIDGSLIGSRSTHRAHLRANGCIEVGNETRALMDKVRPMDAPPGLHETVRQLANERLKRV